MGLGTSPLGVSQLGLHLPSSSLSAGGASGAARFIDPTTGKYVASSEAFASMPANRQRVELAVGTVLGSSSGRPDFGVRFPSTGSATAAAQLEASVRSALYRMTDIERSIRLDSVTVEAIGYRTILQVRFTDLTSNSAQVVTVG